MKTVTLINAERASDAGSWCMNNIGYHLWDLEVAHLGTADPRYHFQFKRPRDAVLFSLKWL